MSRGHLNTFRANLVFLARQDTLRYVEVAPLSLSFGHSQYKGRDPLVILFKLILGTEDGLEIPVKLL